MARSRGQSRNRRPAPELGVGGLAGDLEHGERAVVESVAHTPAREAAGAPMTGPVASGAGGRAPSPGFGAADLDLFAPTTRPYEPITTGLDDEPVFDADGLFADDYELFRVMARISPSPGVMRLLGRVSR
jgi:hypothetical protein